MNAFPAMGERPGRAFPFKSILSGAPSAGRAGASALLPVPVGSGAPFSTLCEPDNWPFPWKATVGGSLLTAPSGHVRRFRDERAAIEAAEREIRRIERRA